MHPVPASLWRQLILLPSILYRLNGMLLAHELGTRVRDEALVPANFTERRQVPIPLILQVHAFCALSSLCTRLSVQALTPLGADDILNLERLEMVGDAALKFVCGECLFHSHRDMNERALSARRSRAVHVFDRKISLKEAIVCR